MMAYLGVDQFVPLEQLFLTLGRCLGGLGVGHLLFAGTLRAGRVLGGPSSRFLGLSLRCLLGLSLRSLLGLTRFGLGPVAAEESP